VVGFTRSGNNMEITFIDWIITVVFFSVGGIVVYLKGE
jgi:hypothetical protein